MFGKIDKMFLAVFILCLLLLSCGTDQKAPDRPAYLRYVGDIEQDSNKDDPGFSSCNGDDHIIQYFNSSLGFRYKGEKAALVSEIRNAFEPLVTNADQNGFVRIRFVINCKGQVGRFRVLESDKDYKPMRFDETITNQLIAVVKELQGWEIMTEGEEVFDYYQYLIFKIENGKIIEILP